MKRLFSNLIRSNTVKTEQMVAPKFYPMQGWKIPGEGKTSVVFGILSIPDKHIGVYHRVIEKIFEAHGYDWPRPQYLLQPVAGIRLAVGIFPAEAVRGIEYSFAQAALSGVDLALADSIAKQIADVPLERITWRF